MTKIICGTLRKKNKFYFTFDVDNNILTMQPIQMKEYPSFLPDLDFDDYPYLKERIDIEGETNNYTYIRFLNVKFISIGRGCFQAWVPAYIIGITNGIIPVQKPEKINKIVFKGECIDRFMTSKSTVSNNWDRENDKLQINIDYGTDKVKKFSYKNLDFSLIPGWNMTTAQKDVSNLITMITSLTVKSKEELSVESIMEIYKCVEKLFSFICYRQHVQFDSIILNMVRVVEGHKTNVNFELHVSQADEKYDLPKVGKNMILKEYSKKIPLLIEELYENPYMLLSFPTNSLMEPVIDHNKYISISAAFESEFELLYPKYKSTRKKNYNDAKQLTLKYLKEQSKNKKHNSKTREYFGDIYDFVDNAEGRLEEQIRQVLKDYSYIIDLDRKVYQKKYQNISFDDYSLAKSFADKRNNFSHGAKLEKFKILEVASYTMIRKINYAMVLKHSGIDKEQIQEIINQVF